LFENASFKVNSKEKIGLVGRNGTGKTTLIKIIIGEESPDSGNISMPKNYKIGYLKQHLDFSMPSVLEEAALGLKEDEKDDLWKAEKILSGLGFTKEDMSKSPALFSGGFQVRLNLAKVLISEPNLLLLDEPTNYLDIMSIRWLEEFLKSWQNELILITHDRSFMDKIVTHTIAIHRKKIKKIKGNTEKLYEQLAKDEEIYEKTRINDEQKKKEIEIFINRFRAKARLAGMVQSRIKALQKMGQKDKLEDIKDLEFTFNYKKYEGKYLINANNVTFGYEKDKLIINNFDISIGSKDRICIIGKNGKGKTTLLKLLAGSLELLAGQINENNNVSKGVYEQTNISTLDPNKTIEEEILYSHSDIDKQRARDACGAMMFEGDMALKKISVLSGGEKSRVMLAKIIATPCNLLMLDEPTNHLDMESCDALLEAINEFKGAVLIVTHNEMFLHSIANRLIVFKNNDISLFEGTYAEFLEKEGWEDEEENIVKCENTSKQNKKEIRKKRSEIFTQRSKVLKPLETKILDIEQKIETYDNELEICNKELIEASNKSDIEQIRLLSKKINELTNKIEILFEELEITTDELQKQKEKFDEILNFLI
jgi:ATP-binding cassette subfamily F protein 3